MRISKPEAQTPGLKLYASPPKVLAPEPRGATRKLLSEKIVAKFDAGEQGTALYADLPKDSSFWGLGFRNPKPRGPKPKPLNRGFSGVGFGGKGGLGFGLKLYGARDSKTP